MEQAIRYDFSFPPKSSSLNNSCGVSTQSSHHHSGHHTIYSHPTRQHHNSNHHSNNHQHNHHHHHHHSNTHHSQDSHSQYMYNNIGLSKSASTSLLSCVNQPNQYHTKNNNYCTSCNNKDCNNSSNHSHSTNLYNNNSNNNKNNQTYKSNYRNNTNSNQQYTILPNTANTTVSSNTSSSSSTTTTTTTNSTISSNNHPAAIGAPTTPKDGNCSFTFDELKNTLAFMEDSPLINNNSKESNVSTNSVNSNSNNSTSVLMVIPTAECSQSLSSSSSTSSAISASSSSSCNSCCAPGFLTKSNSNPMLLSAGSTTSSNSSATSPKNDCNCNTVQLQSVHHHHNHHQQQQHQHHTIHHQYQNQTSSVLDLLIKKESTTQIDLVNHTTLLAPITANINPAIETAAKKYRSAAQISEATCCWKGKLPAKQYKTPIVYSTKVFVGGLPWDITEEDLIKEFGVFGPCRVEWTNKEKFNLLSGSSQVESEQTQSSNRRSINSNKYNNHQQNTNGNTNQDNSNNSNNNSQSKQRSSPGFAYVIYESEYSVRSLVGNCIEDYQHGRDRVEYYFKISTRRVRNKEVQIIPWILADNNFALCTPKELDPKKTVFVGNLHGTMTARDLAHIMNELFGCVVYAGIDIDKLKYPIGSGRVTFSHQQNFMRAVRAAFVDIQSSKFSKRIQIDPYLEDVQCCLCFNDKGIYFCRDFQCFNYYCGACWDKQHSYNNQMGNHKPLMRKREDKI